MLVFYGCKKNRNYFPKNIEPINVEIVSFDQALLNINPNNTEAEIKKIYSDYQDFMDVYVEGVLGLMVQDTAMLCKEFTQFLSDSAVIQTNAEVKKQFSNIEDIQNELNTAFSRMHYLYPELEIPKIYFFVSGLYASIFTYENIIGVGVDMYLGSDFKGYNGIVYDYQKNSMDKKFLAGDILSYYISLNFPFNSKENRLLEYMLHQGKLIYLLSELLPDSPYWEVIGYTKEQWDWCIKWEKEIWNQIMDKRDLFKTESMIITSYINDGPFTAEISQESPGRLGIWVGWRIIDSYMRHNEDVTLQELMKDGDAQKILKKSFYKP